MSIKNKMRKLSVLFICFLVFLGVGVSKFKYEVVFMRRTLSKINNEIVRIADDLRVYEAEWSYLNDPKRLAILASKYLPDMKPIEHKQILRYNDFINMEYENKADAKRQAFDNLLNSLM